ncbi:hypothetical protein GJ496_011132 [Pomphorhynchus laevis]|nr:hypothetical protein GJ496_011132 [Pomphorhynchus laevis]
MLTALISRCLVLIFGTIYPAYRSYKVIEHKNLKQYLHYLRYWVVFACFVVVETVCDLFISWIPFYYELKILIILCLLLPPGSTFVYTNYIQPKIRTHEAEIDRFLESTKMGGYNAVVSAGSRLLKYSSDMFINTALRGSSLFGSSLLARSASSNSIYFRNSARTEYDIMEVGHGTTTARATRRGKHCYTGQYANTIGTSGQYILQDVATAFVRQLGHQAMTLNSNTVDDCDDIDPIGENSCVTDSNGAYPSANDVDHRISNHYRRRSEYGTVASNYGQSSLARYNKEPMSSPAIYQCAANQINALYHDIDDQCLNYDDDRDEGDAADDNDFQDDDDIYDADYNPNEQDSVVKARRPLTRQSHYNRCNKQSTDVKLEEPHQQINSNEVRTSSAILDAADPARFSIDGRRSSLAYRLSGQQRNTNVAKMSPKEDDNGSGNNSNNDDHHVVSNMNEESTVSIAGSSTSTTGRMLTRLQIRSIKQREHDHRNRNSMSSSYNIDVVKTTALQ